MGSYDDAARFMPVGLQVYFDARLIKVDDKRCGFNYQACVVLHGPWPKAPFPTVLNYGDERSFSPAFNDRNYFYYVSYPLERNLNTKLQIYLENHWGKGFVRPIVDLRGPRYL